MSFIKFINRIGCGRSNSHRNDKALIDSRQERRSSEASTEESITDVSLLSCHQNNRYGTFSPPTRATIENPTPEHSEYFQSSYQEPRPVENIINNPVKNTSNYDYMVINKLAKECVKLIKEDFFDMATRAKVSDGFVFTIKAKEKYKHDFVPAAGHENIMGVHKNTLLVIIIQYICKDNEYIKRSSHDGIKNVVSNIKERIEKDNTIDAEVKKYFCSLLPENILL